MVQQLRQELDKPSRKQIRVLAGEGRFCNRTCFGQISELS